MPCGRRSPHSGGSPRARWPAGVAVRVRIGVHTGEPRVVTRRLRRDRCALRGAHLLGGARRAGRDQRGDGEGACRPARRGSRGYATSGSTASRTSAGRCGCIRSDRRWSQRGLPAAARARAPCHGWPRPVDGADDPLRTGGRYRSAGGAPSRATRPSRHVGRARRGGQDATGDRGRRARGRRLHRWGAFRRRWRPSSSRANWPRRSPRRSLRPIREGESSYSAAV